jgi:hypothetical protein
MSPGYKPLPQEKCHECDHDISRRVHGISLSFNLDCQRGSARRQSIPARIGSARHTFSTSILIFTGFASVSYTGDLRTSSWIVASSASPFTLNFTRISR